MSPAHSRTALVSLMWIAASLCLASCGGGGGHGASGDAHSGEQASKKSGGHGASEAKGHGSKPASSHGSKPASGHNSKPASSHGSKPDGGHGSKSASSSHGSGSGGNPATDASDLLDLLEAGGQHDPSRFVEIDLGTFRVTHKLADEQHAVLVKFRLFGIVSENKQEHLHEELPKFDKRIRDAVISLVQKTEAEQLAEPSLKWLKAELVAAINRVVQDRALSDVAFSDFSMEGV